MLSWHPDTSGMGMAGVDGIDVALLWLWTFLMWLDNEICLILLQAGTTGRIYLTFSIFRSTFN